ncbi:anti-sigma factor [Microbacterium sp. HJ5]
MSHLDPDQLTLLALGEPVASSVDTEHLAGCAACAAELADLRRTVVLARATIDDGPLETPPDRVWGRVVDELGLTDAAPAATSERETVPEPTAPTPPPATPKRASRRPWLWALAASLVLVAGVGIGAWVVTATTTPEVVAAAELDPFPDHPDARGSADVEAARDGSRTLMVTLDAAAAGDGYREVWLIRNDAAALISLGVLEGESGSFVIPDGLDLAEYSIVDVSVEPIDGDPAHSGDSIVRGTLS